MSGKDHPANDFQQDDIGQIKKPQVEAEEEKVTPDTEELFGKTITESTGFVWLQNRGSDCFVNGVVWCLLYSSIAKYLCSGDSTNAVCSFFARIAQENRKLKTNTQELRDVFPSMSIRQNDVVEFYKLLVTMCPTGINERMTFEWTNCVVCEKNDLTRENVSVLTFSERPSPSDSFEDILRQLTVGTLNWGNCTGCKEDTMHMISNFHTANNDFMAIEFPWAHEIIAIRNVPNNIQLFDKQWNISSAIEYIPGELHGMTGHYVAWVRKEDSWFLLDDQEEQEMKMGHLKKGLTCIKILFLEKI